VQARRNGWDLAGLEGNRRGPINRETFRVLALRDDGGLEVAPVRAPEPDGVRVGERLVLPAGYVTEHLALGYAATVHAAQGVTVDTTHSVVSVRTGPASLYVGLSRGREANTAHVATTAMVDDRARGRDDQVVHRDPIAVLSDVLDASADKVQARSAVATATESATEAGTVRTPAELLANAAQLAATERTAIWLDQLADQGLISAGQRARIAAEDGAASLTRVLRRVELAGRNPRQALVDAVAERPLAGARNTTNVLYARLADDRRFDPIGTGWSDWIPRIDNPDWRDYLQDLAAAADRRVTELGRATAADPPAWAVEALGPPPPEGVERTEWEHHAGIVAAYRELRGHDDPGEALGPAPQAGQVEAYAAYRAAWRVLGRPEVDREELEMSDGQLRMRIRAHDREAAWAPRYVANEQAGTAQAAATHRRTAALRRAEANGAADHPERARLEREARESAALADILDVRAGELQRLDDARARWLAHTAGTRAAAERAKAELAARHAADAEPEQQVTAEEWLAAHQAALAEDDRHRQITNEADFTDLIDRSELRDDHARHDQPNAGLTETVIADLREVAAAEPRPVAEDVVRVPSADETSAAIAQTQRVLAEIQARDAAAQQAEADQRAAELIRWHAEDQHLHAEAVDQVDTWGYAHA
jgi:hypothetical protein